MNPITPNSPLQPTAQLQAQQRNQLSPSLPFQVAKTYGVSKPTSAAPAQPLPGTSPLPIARALDQATFSAQPIERTNQAISATSVDRLVAANVSVPAVDRPPAAPISTPARQATPAPPIPTPARQPTATLPFYRHPADQNSAATEIVLGRGLDVDA